MIFGYIVAATLTRNGSAGISYGDAGDEMKRNNEKNKAKLLERRFPRRLSSCTISSLTKVILGVVLFMIIRKDVV